MAPDSQAAQVCLWGPLKGGMGLALGVAVSLGAAPCSWDWRPLSYEGRNPGRAWEPVAKSPHPLSGSKVQSSGPARGAATRLEHSRAFLLTGTDRMEVVTGAKAGSSPRPAPALLPLRLCHGTLKATKCENPYRTQCPFTIHPSSTHHPSTTHPASQPASHPSIHTPNKTRDIPTTSEGSLVPVWVCSVLWVTKDQGALFAAWVLGGCVCQGHSHHRACSRVGVGTAGPLPSPGALPLGLGESGGLCSRRDPRELLWLPSCGGCVSPAPMSTRGHLARWTKGLCTRDVICSAVGVGGRTACIPGGRGTRTQGFSFQATSCESAALRTQLGPPRPWGGTSNQPQGQRQPRVGPFTAGPGEELSPGAEAVPGDAGSLAGPRAVASVS